MGDENATPRRGLSKAERKRRRKAAASLAAETIRAASDSELRTMRFELGQQLEALTTQKRELAARLDAIKKEMNDRHSGSRSGFGISDHAVVRYLERIKGLDIAAIRDEIAELAQQAKQARGGRKGFRLHEELNAVIGVNEVDGTVTTIFTDTELSVLASATENEE